MKGGDEDIGRHQARSAQGVALHQALKINENLPELRMHTAIDQSLRHWIKTNHTGRFDKRAHSHSRAVLEFRQWQTIKI